MAEAEGHIPPVLLGVSHASTPYVAVMDDDVLPPWFWLKRLYRWFHDPRVGVVGGPAYTPGVSLKTRAQKTWGQITFYGRFMGNLSAIPPTSKAREVATVMEGNLAARRELFLQCAPDPFLNQGDAPLYGLDLTLKAQRLGYRVIFDPAAWVHHFPAARTPELSREDLPARAYTYNRNYTYLALKHYPFPRKILFLLWWFLVGERNGTNGLLSFILSQRNKKGAIFLAALKGKWAGIRGAVPTLWKGKKEGKPSAPPPCSLTEEQGRGKG